MATWKRAWELVGHISTAQWVLGLMIGALTFLGGVLAGLPLQVLYVLILPMAVVTVFLVIGSIALYRVYVRPPREHPAANPALPRAVEQPQLGASQDPITFGPQHQGAREEYLKWWHVLVSSSVRLNDCRVFLLVEGRRLPLRWPTWQGPQEHWTLR